VKDVAKKTERALREEIKELGRRLEESEATLHAIRAGEVDAIVVTGAAGKQVFSLNGSDSIYRMIVENMREAALTVTFAGRILYCNDQFGKFVQTPLERIVGHNLVEFVCAQHTPALTRMLEACRDGDVKGRLSFAGSNGVTVPSHVSATLLNAPDGIGVCLVATDLTNLEASADMLQKVRVKKDALERAGHSLAKVNDELEEQVRKRTMALRRTVEALEGEIEGRRLGELRVLAANLELERRADMLRRLAAEVVQAGQKERQRLAHVLHDHVQQILVAAQLHANALDCSRHEPTRKVAAVVIDLLSEAVAASRSLAIDLSPPVLYDAGLVACLKWLAHSFADRHDLAVEIAADGEVVEENESLRIFLFEAVRELLFNVVKHAKTKCAAVSLKEQSGTLSILVGDQGIGFDPHVLDTDVGVGFGFGLVSIREQLGLFGGAFHIESAPEKGSRFTMTVPLQPAVPVPLGMA